MDEKSTTALLIGLIVIGVVLAIGLVLTVGGAGRGPQGMTVKAPGAVYVNEPFEVYVIDSLGNPLGGAVVTYGAQSVTTAADGKARFTATKETVIRAERTGYAPQVAQIGVFYPKLILIAPAEPVTGPSFKVVVQDDRGNLVQGATVTEVSTGIAKVTDVNGEAWFDSGLEEKSTAELYVAEKQYYTADRALVRKKNHPSCSNACSMKAKALGMSRGHKGGREKGPGKLPSPGGPGERVPKPKLPPRQLGESILRDTLQIVDALSGEVLQEKQFLDPATGRAKALHGVESTDRGYVVGIYEDSKLVFLDDNLNTISEVQLTAPAREVAVWDDPVTGETTVAVTYGNEVGVFASNGTRLETYADEQSLWSVAIDDKYVLAMAGDNSLSLWERVKKPEPRPPDRRRCELRLGCGRGGGGGGKQRVELDKECPECKVKAVAANEYAIIAYEITKDATTGALEFGPIADTPEQKAGEPMCAQHCAAMYGLTLPADEWGGPGYCKERIDTTAECLAADGCCPRLMECLSIGRREDSLCPSPYTTRAGTCDGGYTCIVETEVPCHYCPAYTDRVTCNSDPWCEWSPPAGTQRGVCVSNGMCEPLVVVGCGQYTTSTSCNEDECCVWQ